MKAAVFILALVGAVGVLAGVTGDTRFYAAIPKYALLSRINVVIFGLVALVAAYGCWRRKIFGWYAGAAFIWMAILWGVFRAVYLMLTFDLDWLGLVLGALGESVKIGIFTWVALRFWRRMRTEFKMPNQSSDPTPPSGAGHL